MHKSKALVSIITLSLIISSLVISFYSEHPKASGKDIYVDDDQRYPDEADGSLYNPYKYIQDAIDAADEGDTIKVLEGLYPGDFVIDKSLTLTSENKIQTIIESGQQNAYLIDITASSVSLEHFTIKDQTLTSHRKAVIHIASDVSGTRIVNNNVNHSKNGYGIQIDGSSNNVVLDNTIDSTRGIFIKNSNVLSIDSNTVGNCTNYPALRLVSSNGNDIRGNLFEKSYYGIYSESSSDNSIFNNTILSNVNSAILMNSGTENTFKNNSISLNGNVGIDLGSSDGSIIGNVLDNNMIGIRIRGDGNVINENLISSNNLYGLHAQSGSSNNIIYNNEFVKRGASNALEEGNNHWDYGGIGNYWDDFYGPDPNNINNTVGPEAYKYARGGVVDNYPLGEYQNQPCIEDPSPSDYEEGVDRSPRLSVTVIDPDPPLFRERLDVYFYYILNNTHNLIGVDRNVESGTEASIWFSSIIKGKNAVYSYGGLGYDYIGVWYVAVEDSYTKTTSLPWVFSTMNTPLDNNKPIAKISVPTRYMVGNDVHAQVNDSISFDASGSNDTDGEIVFYKWTFPPATTVINEVSYTHIFKSPGSYTVSLVVIDNDGSSSLSNMTVVIESSANRPPVADAVIDPKGYYEGYAGSKITFLGSDSSDPDGDSLTYEWNFGDGTTGTGEITTHTYSKAGKYTGVKLTVTDEHGETNTSITYAIVKTKTEDSPGYEIVLVFIGLLLVGILNKKRKNYFR